ncbi:MAG: DUF4403 family protein [Gelidibacter sp.]
MDYQQESTNHDISLSLPIKISFTALKHYLNKEFVGTTISRPNSNGKTVNYFKILDIDFEQTDIEKYNIELMVKLETLTTFYNKRELDISVLAFVNLDVGSQKIYIDTYKIDSKGKNWFANQLLKSMINTIIYQKIIKNLNIELLPIIKKNILQLNEKLASKIEVKSGISILGSMEKVIIAHFEIKQNDIWVIINIKGWGIIDVESLDL